MGIITIEPATRAGMRFIISLYGMSETGKTLSALKLSAGLEPDPKKRGFLDTEGGQRGRAYVDQIPGGYLYGHLKPPFTPERYIEAIAEFEAAGCNVLTIDSVSHAWFAEGGVLDMVEVANEKNDLAKWARPKRRLGKMTRRILSSDMHILLCSRAKQPLIKDDAGKLTPGPVVPIQEKTLRFDMTIMAQMLGDGHFTVKAPEGKCPGVLRSIFAAGELMNEEMGRKLSLWINSEQTKTPEQRDLEIRAAAEADKGKDAFLAFWGDLTKPQREFLKPGLGNYQSAAKAADEERKEPPIASDDADQQVVNAADESPFTIVDKTIEVGEGILADEAAAEAETADKAFLEAERSAGILITSLNDPELKTVADLDEFKVRGQEVIRGFDITEDQKAVLVGRFNGEFLSRRRTLESQGKRTRATA